MFSACRLLSNLLASLMTPHKYLCMPLSPMVHFTALTIDISIHRWKEKKRKDKKSEEKDTLTQCCEYRVIQAIRSPGHLTPSFYDSSLLLRAQYEVKGGWRLEVFKLKNTPSSTFAGSRFTATPFAPQYLFQAATRPRTSSRLFKQRGPCQPSSTIHFDEPLV